ncbi:MAG: hypothetical protein IT196_05280 [Acidimicrobiales bacterium]|nr:hypothetical protein [Acidimicrobiales bacterium]
MRGALVIAGRYIATALTALATIVLAAWSGVLAGFVTSPGDNSRGFWAAASATLAGLALLPAVACVAAAKSSGVAVRLAALTAGTWLVVALGILIDDSGRLSLPLLGAMCALTLVVLYLVLAREPERSDH